MQGPRDKAHGNATVWCHVSQIEMKINNKRHNWICVEHVSDHVDDVSTKSTCVCFLACKYNFPLRQCDVQFIQTQKIQLSCEACNKSIENKSTQTDAKEMKKKRSREIVA